MISPSPARPAALPLLPCRRRLDRRLKRAFLASCEAIETGSLTVTTPEGSLHRFGTGMPEADIAIRDWAVIAATATRGDIGFGEAYVAGHWDSTSLEALTTLLLLNLDRLAAENRPGPLQGLVFRLANTLLRANSRRGSSRNIRAHYDVGNEFYRLWLDPGMSYSSALFTSADRDLSRAQDRKYDRILHALGPEEDILEIGCGWGGFAERAADQGRRVTGITVSPAQKGYADARLNGRAEIRLQDYRDTRGRFSNIVFIEMIEAVGERFWPTYFSTLRDRLMPDGQAMIQAITVPDANLAAYRRRSDYIRHYIFPGGMLLSEAAIAAEATRAGLRVEDCFRFGADYAETCRQWARRMDEAAPRILALGHDQKFLRSWRYYLDSCAAAFATGRTNVVQIRLTTAEGAS